MAALRQGWFDVREVAPGIHVIEEPLQEEQVKSYLVVGTDRAALIDTGMGVANIKREVESITSLPVVVLLSHAHWDHVGDAWRFDDVRIHPAEAAVLAAGRPPGRLVAAFGRELLTGELPPGFEPDRFEIRVKLATAHLSDGDVIDLGGRSLVALHTPGHSSGLMVFVDVDARLMLSTDTVYVGEIYVLHPDSSLADYVVALRRLEAMSAGIDTLLPAHGPVPIPPTVIGGLADALQQIETGRAPDERVEDIERHLIGDFPVLVLAER